MSWTRLVAVACMALLVAHCGGESKTKAPASPGPVIAAPTESPVAAAKSDEEKQDTKEDEQPPAEEKPEVTPATRKEILEQVTPEARASFEHGVKMMGSDPEAALSAFEAAARYSPELYAAYHNSAVLLEGKGRMSEARQAYKKALSARSDFAPAVIGLAALMERQGDRKGAAKLLRRRLDAQPEESALRAAYAEVLVRSDELQEARNQAIKVLRKDERSAHAMLVMGMIYRRQKMLELSQMALGQSIEFDPNLGTAYAELGLVLLAQDKNTQAVLAFERAAKASPTVAAIHNNLGALRNEVGAYKGAVEALQKATDLDGSRPEYYLNLGNALRGEQRYSEAEEAYKKALKTGGGTKAALFNLGILYLDNDLPGKETMARYRACIDNLRSYESGVVVSEEEKATIQEYVETAEKAIRNEEKRQKRDKKRALRDAKRKAEEEAEKAKEAAEAQQGEGAGGEGATPEPPSESEPSSEAGDGV